jgi:hypothetical protein
VLTPRPTPGVDDRTWKLQTGDSGLKRRHASVGFCNQAALKDETFLSVFIIVWNVHGTIAGNVTELNMNMNQKHKA